MKKVEVIEINGRRYNAHTGELLGAQVVASKPSKMTVHVTDTKPAHKVTARQPRQAAKHARPHAPVASRLLMRKAVKQPAPHRQIRSQGPLRVNLKPSSELTSKPHVERRLVHAKNVHKSQHISHFTRSQAKPYPITPGSGFANDPYQAAVRHIPVAPQPDHSQRQSTSNMLEAALQAATSHEAKPLPKSAIKKRSRLFGRLRTA